ncbi:unannotated protein [freshwater metagenome]|uniref:Unannotated protein n=1 Tax=freshwater metagenome TaxID=449393 RepID=A0A6J7KIM8_9ZZZZ
MDRVEDRARQAELRAERDAEDHVADVADEREGQHALDVRLRDGAEDPDHHRQERDDHEERGHAVVVGEEQRLRADDRVDADLRQEAGEHRGHGCRGRRVGVRQPRRHREDRRLDAERQEQRELEHEPDVGVQLAQLERQVGEVQRARGAVDEADRREEQERREQRDDHVRRAGADARGRAAQRDQHVARDEQDLEADVEVEEVAGEERVADPGRQHEVGRVEDRERQALLLVRRALAVAVDQDAEGHRGGDHQHERRQAVGDEDDAHGRLPAAERRDLRAVAVGGDQQEDGDDEDRDEGADGDRALQAWPADADGELRAGGQERQDDGQRDEVGGAHAPLVMAWSSSGDSVSSTAARASCAASRSASAPVSSSSSASRRVATRRSSTSSCTSSCPCSCQER